MSSLPEIPKPLAKLVRAAQEELINQRNRTFFTEREIRKITMDLSFFEADPEAWALEKYGKRATPKSYPVVTRIEKDRERLNRYISRRPVREADLLSAQANLERVEANVLEQMTRVRPSRGTVPWPSPLPSFQDAMDAYNTEEDLVDAEAQSYAEVRRKEIDEAFLEEIKEIEKEYDIQREELRRDLESRTPEERQAFRNGLHAIVQILKNNKGLEFEALSAIGKYLDKKK